VSYQPEEYAAYVHEKNYGLFETKDYLWGTFVWNMFDFGSAHRNEGDVLGVNTKGLVTFDRQTKKDAFFFYKANWSREPVAHIVGEREVQRPYAINDVKVYSNADSVDLSVNGAVVGTMTADRCPLRTCVFRDVRLGVGDNAVVATGHHGGATVPHEVRWNLPSADVNIAAGQLESGLRSAAGDLFGTDKFYTAGTYGTFGQGAGDTILNTDEPDLYEHYRYGRFGYQIPLDNGTYVVRLGFIEPNEDKAEGQRVFDVSANGAPVLDKSDVRREAGDYRRVVTRTFTVTVSDGLLRLQFSPSQGEAIVSTIMVRKGALAAADRDYLVRVLTTTAQPVLEALADGKLHERLPVHDWEQQRRPFTHLEAFARTLAGVAPWLELGPDNTPEGQLRARFIDLARRSLINATDPKSPDHMTFDESNGDQPLVESAYRFASMYHLGYMALNDDLPDDLDPGAVRSAITAVVHRMFDVPGVFDSQGWLQLGAVGQQPGLREDYNATGSLYVCLTGLVHLGLPPDHPLAHRVHAPASQLMPPGASCTAPAPTRSSDGQLWYSIGGVEWGPAPQQESLNDVDTAR
jgi:hypothetical protein